MTETHMLPALIGICLLVRQAKNGWSVVSVGPGRCRRRLRGFVDFEYTFRRGVKQRLGIEYFDDAVNINDLVFNRATTTDKLNSPYSHHL